MSFQANVSLLTKTLEGCQAHLAFGDMSHCSQCINQTTCALFVALFTFFFFFLPLGILHIVFSPVLERKRAGRRATMSDVDPQKKKNANVLSFNTRALLPRPHSPAFIPQYPESSPISILCPPPPLCGKISIWQNTPGDHQLSWQKPHKSRNAALSCKEQFVSDCKQHVCCRDCNCDCCD